MKIKVWGSNQAWLVVILLLFIHLLLLTNTRFTLWPEMMVYPYLLNNGYQIYTDIINPYPPSLLIFLAKFSILINYSVAGYQLLTWGTILLIDIQIYLFSLKILHSHKISILSTLFFALLSIPFGSNGLWFDLIQSPLILLSIFHFYQYLHHKKTANLDNALLFASISVFIKQQSIWLVAFYIIIICVIYKKNTISYLKKVKKTYIFVLLSVVLHALYFVNLKSLDTLIQWTIYFPLLKSSSAPGYILFPSTRQIFTLLSIAILFLPAWMLSKKEIKILMLIGFAMFLFAFPRFDYFHLIPALSVVAILFGINMQLFHKALPAVKIFSVCAALFLTAFSVRYYIINWTDEVRFFEKDILLSAKIVSQLTNPGDRIYIQNGPDQLLPLAHRLPPKPWADEFPWYLEDDHMQNRIVESMKFDPPKYIIFKPYSLGTKYNLGAYKPELISVFIANNYEYSQKISDTLWIEVKKDTFK